uniref:LysM domain-containing protein n=1 Tax=Candidatus Kentrum sp. SD TaxID=2126332 RepID=A0A451BHQ1_9GAMM|nr:MAG: hypothetical protein BECKSD772F_GA0070984_100228 [Candidatus Kentron sp. SD]VFK39171.1 MAG: hypothetical protein BECKSD772E_GA0070983_100228 [Candidatus Kentron sp. SD]VFK77813.1 MAG: hypothetical protein BECKSD772D_GA0070982_100227 [Candidatus Kentron sp. SD]
MALSNPFKLEKLKIKAYKSRSRSMRDLIGTFEAMFNPTSFTQKHEIIYGCKQGMNSSGREVDYQRSKPTDLSLQLILDGTGVDPFSPGGKKKVSEQVKEFLDLTFRMNGSIHEPNYLVAEWGELIFSCRLGSVEVSYTSFNRDGAALRAELDITLLSDKEVKARMAEENKSSPDLSHGRIVKSGDTLPLLCNEIYGSMAHYPRVAEVNNLDDFRRLVPGQRIIFPPLEE